MIEKRFVLRNVYFEQVCKQWICVVTSEDSKIIIPCSDRKKAIALWDFIKHSEISFKKLAKIKKAKKKQRKLDAKMPDPKQIPALNLHIKLNRRKPAHYTLDNLADWPIEILKDFASSNKKIKDELILRLKYGLGSLRKFGS